MSILLHETVQRNSGHDDIDMDKSPRFFPNKDQDVQSVQSEQRKQSDQLINPYQENRLNKTQFDAIITVEVVPFTHDSNLDALSIQGPDQLDDSKGQNEHFFKKGRFTVNETTRKSSVSSREDEVNEFELARERKFTFAGKNGQREGI